MKINLKETMDSHAEWLSGKGGSRADMRDANMSGADMSDADMRGANMRDADMRDADMRGAIGYIVGPQRADGYRFDLRAISGEWCVVAGCNTDKNWSIEQYREHAAAYGDAAKTAETLAILAYLEAIASAKPAKPAKETTP